MTAIASEPSTTIGPAGGSSTWTGIAVLTRLALRRERTIAPWWFLVLVSGALTLVAYIHRNMPTPEVMAAYAEAISANSFFRALGGSTVVPDIGVLSSWRSGGLLYIVTALAALTAAIRYSRADEDTGRTELLRAGAIGRSDPLTAAVLVAGGISVIGGALVAIALIAIGLEPVGSLAYAAAVVAAGWVFGAVGVLAAELASTARTARTIGLYLLLAAYIARYAGDATGWLWLKYISPLGWSHLVEPYQTDRWWVLAVPLAVAAALAGAAYRVAARRDLGAGVIPQRRGPAAAPWLRGPVALSWRLNRGLWLGWAGGIAAFAAGAGGATTLGHQLAALPGDARHLLLNSFGGVVGDVVDAALWPLILIFAQVVTLFPVLMVRRLRAEEASGRAEIVQSTGLGRVRWAAGHLAVAGLGTAALLAVAGLVFGTFFAVLVGDPATDVGRVLGATVGTLPAALLVGAVGVLAYGLVPRAAVAVSWLVWAATAAAGQVVGPLYGQWGGTPFEPFHYIPNTAAGAPFDPLPGLVMLLVTATLVGAGLLALSRRDFGR